MEEVSFKAAGGASRDGASPALATSSFVAEQVQAVGGELQKQPDGDGAGGSSGEVSEASRCGDESTCSSPGVNASAPVGLSKRDAVEEEEVSRVAQGNLLAFGQVPTTAAEVTGVRSAGGDEEGAEGVESPSESAAVPTEEGAGVEGPAGSARPASGSHRVKAWRKLSPHFACGTWQALKKLWACRC